LFWALASCLLVVYEAAKGNRKMCENCTEKGQVNGAKKKMEKGRNIFLLIHSRSVLDLPTTSSSTQCLYPGLFMRPVVATFAFLVVNYAS